MVREPKMLHNPGDDFEVFSGGVLYQFKSGENRIVDGDTAYQILTHQNTPLIEVKAIAESIPVIKKEMPKVESNDYSKMKYSELRSIASAKGIFKVGMNQAQLVELLNGHKKA